MHKSRDIKLRKHIYCQATYLRKWVKEGTELKYTTAVAFVAKVKDGALAAITIAEHWQAKMGLDNDSSLIRPSLSNTRGRAIDIHWWYRGRWLHNPAYDLKEDSLWEGRITDATSAAAWLKSPSTSLEYIEDKKGGGGGFLSFPALVEL
jgi:hypothetical protein